MKSLVELMKLLDAPPMPIKFLGKHTEAQLIERDRQWQAKVRELLEHIEYGLQYRPMTDVQNSGYPRTGQVMSQTFSRVDAERTAMTMVAPGMWTNMSYGGNAQSGTYTIGVSQATDMITPAAVGAFVVDGSLDRSTYRELVEEWHRRPTAHKNFDH